MLKISKNHKKAYSLIELAIVILIVSILISGGMSFATRSAHNAKLQITNDRMASISEALSTFLAVNKRLPCPASLVEAKTLSPDYGDEGSSAGSCSGAGYTSTSSPNLVYGMVPVHKLGLESDIAEDGFGSKIGYFVDKRFTSSSTFGTATATGNIIIKNRSGGVLHVITNDAIMALVSYGSNKSGAYDSNASDVSIQNARSSDIDEFENDIDSGDTESFDNILISDSRDSEIFDDVIFYKTRNELVLTSKNSSLIKCPALSNSTTDIIYNGTAMEWPVGLKDQIVVSTTECPVGYNTTVTYPTRRCGAFGVWDEVVHACTNT